MSVCNHSTHTMKPSTDALRGLLHKILSYEPNIYNQIMSYVFYPMKDSNELREAAKLWLEDASTAITKYGHIGKWNTSNVTYMSGMFHSAKKFNKDIGDGILQGICFMVLINLINLLEIGILQM